MPRFVGLVLQQHLAEQLAALLEYLNLVEITGEGSPCVL